MNNETNLNQSQMYLVMAIGIHQFQITHDKKILQKVLDSVRFEEDNEEDTLLYKYLLLRFVSDDLVEYIEGTLKWMDREPLLYEETIINNFRILKEMSTIDIDFIIHAEGQLRLLANSDEYAENEKITIDYMLSEKLLYSSIVFKHNGRILREKIVLLKPLIGTLKNMRQNQLIL